MSLSVFQMTGVPYQRRERLETALKMAGAFTTAHYIAWVAADPFSGGFKVIITGPSFQREARFENYDDLDVIREGVKAPISDDGWDL